MHCQPLPPSTKSPTFPLPPIYPVVIKMPDLLKDLTGRARVNFLSQAARRALAISGRKSGRPIKDLKKDAKGAPIAENGIYWSLSHKSRYVAAVTAPCPVGIDIETYRTFDSALKCRIASQQEWRLGTFIEPNLLFLRFWTAKEAVLKAMGVGMAGLSKCRVTAIPDAQQLCLTYGTTPFRVIQKQFNDHLAAVTIDHHPIFWTHLLKFI